jgi:hypothetical protein
LPVSSPAILQNTSQGVLWFKAFLDLWLSPAKALLASAWVNMSRSQAPEAVKVLSKSLENAL